MRGNPVRKTVLYGAAGAVFVAAALLVVVFAATQDAVGWPADGGTLLWVLGGRAADGVSADAIGVLCVGPLGAYAITLPADLAIKGRDGRLTELGTLGAEDGWRTACAAVGAMLGVPLSAYIVLESEAVAGFCDARGPVVVECPTPVTYRAPRGDREITVERGRHALSGPELLAYVAGTSSEAAAARWRRAAEGLLATCVAADGPELRARSNLARADLARVADALARGAEALVVEELPSTVVVRDGVARRIAQVVETEKLVATTLRAQDLLTAEDVSVVVFNGTGQRLVATRAALYLQARGFRVPKVGNADAFDYTSSCIVCLTDVAKAWILRESLPGAARITSPEEFGARYESLRPLVPRGTDLVLVVGGGMEWSGDDAS